MSELRRLVTMNELLRGRASGPLRLEAAAEERVSVAERLGLASLARLEATLTLAPLGGGRLVKVSGVLEAVATRQCVVSLDPFEEATTARFEALFDLDPTGPALDLPFDPQGPDEPEPVDSSGLDLGELVVQQYSLALDPHPRQPGAKLSPEAEQALALASEDAGSFAALRPLAERKG